MGDRRPSRRIHSANATQHRHSDFFTVLATTSGKPRKPFGFLDELAALDLKDLDPAAAFVVLGVTFKRRHQAAQGEVPDLLEALFDVLAGRLLAAVELKAWRTASTCSAAHRMPRLYITVSSIAFGGSLSWALYIALISWRTG